jgi:hypothetical protein
MLAVVDAPLSEAVRTAFALAVTEPAVAVNEAEFEDAGTVTVAGTVKVLLFEDNDTVVPPAGAAPDSLTVQDVLPLEVRLDALHFREDKVTGAVREISNGNDETPTEAVIVAVPFEVKVPALALKVAEVEAARTVTEEGTVSNELLEDKATTTPPAGAAPDSVTVHESVALEVRLDVLQLKEESLAGATRDSVLLADVLLSDALIVPLWFVVKAPIVAVKVALLEPALTATEAGTLMIVELADSPTLAPPEPAAALRFTVHALVLEGPSVVGEQVSPVTVALDPAEIEPPAAVVVIPSPARVAPSALAAPIVRLLTPAAKVTATVAATPFAIVVLLMLHATQVLLPEPAEQVIVLPAALRAGPASTEKAATLAAG